MFGTDIFVPKVMIEKATEVLDAYRNGESVDEEYEGEDEV